MKAHSIGRALGAGMRVAGRIAGQRVAAGATGQAGAQAAAAAQSRAAGQAAGRATRGVARGVGGFLRPFGRVGGLLWLEVTGVFFSLFAVVFARALWLYRASYAHGPDHQKFLVSAPLLLLFLYLSVSSFWRARRG
ncbi:MAG: hypothetical protein ABR898_07000 [Terracidiphilus sp.]